MPGIESDNKMYLTAGLRFGQRDAIELLKRPFGSVEEMDEEMIARWNETIGDEDLVFVLGAFAIAGTDRIKEIIPRLRGVKAIIMGDEDRGGPRWWVDNGFHSASRHPIFFDNLGIVMSYRPMVSCDRLNFFGRAEGSGRLPNHLCVAADAWDFRPVRLADLIREVGTFMDVSERTNKVRWN